MTTELIYLPTTLRPTKNRQPNTRRWTLTKNSNELWRARLKGNDMQKSRVIIVGLLAPSSLFYIFCGSTVDRLRWVCPVCCADQMRRVWWMEFKELPLKGNGEKTGTRTPSKKMAILIITLRLKFVHSHPYLLFFFFLSYYFVDVILS